MFVSKSMKAMEEQSNSVTPMAMSNGLYMGLALILNSVVFYVVGSPFAPASAYISYAIIIAGIAWSMKTYKENNLEAGVTYGRALGLGTLQALFSSIILGFFTFVLFKLVDTTLIDKFMSFFEAQLVRGGTAEAQVDTLVAMYRKIMTPLVYAFIQIFSVTFYGFLFSLILAIFFKKTSTNPFHGVE